MTHPKNLNVLSCRPSVAAYSALLEESMSRGISRSLMLRLILAERYSLPDEFVDRATAKDTDR